MKKVSHSLRKVSHSYKKGVALVGMRHLKTAFINMRFLSCVCFKDNRDNGDNFFSYRNFCFNDNRDAFFLAFVLKTIETIETICSFVPLGGIFI